MAISQCWVIQVPLCSRPFSQRLLHFVLSSYETPGRVIGSVVLYNIIVRPLKAIGVGVLKMRKRCRRLLRAA